MRVEVSGIDQKHVAISELFYDKRNVLHYHTDNLTKASLEFIGTHYNMYTLLLLQKGLFYLESVAL